MMVLLMTLAAWSNPSLVFVERNKDFHIYHPMPSSEGTIRFSFSDLPYISMDMQSAQSFIYVGDAVYEEFPNSIYLERYQETMGISETVPLEIIPIPAEMISLGGKTFLPLPEPTRLNLVKLEMQQYRVKHQIAKAHRDHRNNIQNKEIALEEELDGVVLSDD